MKKSIIIVSIVMAIAATFAIGTTGCLSAKEHPGKLLSRETVDNAKEVEELMPIGRLVPHFMCETKN